MFMVLKKNLMPDNTEIQLEKWDRPEAIEQQETLIIAVYPVARNSSRWVDRGERFRLQISANRYTNYLDDAVERDYDALVSGEKKLADMASHFWFPDRDAWLLGLSDVEPV